MQWEVWRYLPELGRYAVGRTLGSEPSLPKLVAAPQNAASVHRAFNTKRLGHLQCQKARPEWSPSAVPRSPKRSWIMTTFFMLWMLLADNVRMRNNMEGLCSIGDAQLLPGAQFVTAR